MVLKVNHFVTKRDSGSEGQQVAVSDEPSDIGRRNALKSIARFSAYVAPTTFVLIDSKSAFAQTCSGAEDRIDELQLRLSSLLAITGGTQAQRRRRRRRIRRLRRRISRLRRWQARNDC